MSEFLDLFQTLTRQRKTEELSREFINIQTVPAKLPAFYSLCKILNRKKDEEELQAIITGSLTKGIPLFTVSRFWTKYNDRFGKTLTYGKKTISLSEIDSAIAEITQILYRIYIKIQESIK
jgi:hypothetical protein